MMDNLVGRNLLGFNMGGLNSAGHNFVGQSRALCYVDPKIFKLNIKSSEKFIYLSAMW